MRRLRLVLEKGERVARRQGERTRRPERLGSASVGWRASSGRRAAGDQFWRLSKRPFRLWLGKWGPVRVWCVTTCVKRVNAISGLRLRNAYLVAQRLVCACYGKDKCKRALLA